MRNGGFEVADESRAGQARDWHLSGGGTLAIDAAAAHGGRQSLRLEKRDGADFVGALQLIDAVPYRGRVVALSGWSRGEGTDGEATWWLRADSPGRRTLFNNSPLHPDTQWTRGRVFLDVPDDAEKLLYGATLAGHGRLWVDDLEVVTVDIASADLLAPAAQAYLDEAAGIIRKHALYSDRVDWSAATRRARVLAAGAQQAEQVHGAVRYLLAALGDHHSFFMPPSLARISNGEVSANDARATSEVMGAKAYLDVPGFLAMNPARMKAFADDLSSRVAKLAESRPCGWIVDLREDTGGNVYPMLGGLALLLGDGTLGYFVRGDERHSWSVGSYYANVRQAQPAAPSALVDSYVAVLTGPRTASSGETVTISFRGRRRTRSFGAPTYGLPTANSPFSLSDGATMLITVSYEADRDGTVYREAIVPDEPVQAGAAGTPLADDPVVRAASAWLDRQPACAAAHS